MHTFHALFWFVVVVAVVPISIQIITLPPVQYYDCLCTDEAIYHEGSFEADYTNALTAII